MPLNLSTSIAGKSLSHTTFILNRRPAQQPSLRAKPWSLLIYQTSAMAERISNSGLFEKPIAVSTAKLVSFGYWCIIIYDDFLKLPLSWTVFVFVTIVFTFYFFEWEKKSLYVCDIQLIEDPVAYTGKLYDSQWSVVIKLVWKAHAPISNSRYLQQFFYSNFWESLR